MSLVSRLGVVLGLDSAEFSAGLGKAESSLNKFGASTLATSLSVAAIGTAFVGAASSAIMFADGINDIAQANDLAVSSVLEFTQALSVSGGHAENATKLLSSLTSKIDEAAGGSQKTRDKFKELGISLKDLGTLNEQDLLEKTIQGLAKIEDPIHRNALAFQMFGKSIKGVDIVGFNEQMQALKGTAADADKPFSAIGDSLDRLDVLSRKMKTDLAINIAEPLKVATEAISNLYEWLGKINGWMESHTDGFNLWDVLLPMKGAAKLDAKIVEWVAAKRKAMQDDANSGHYTPMASGDFTPSIMTGLKTKDKLRDTPLSDEDLKRQKAAEKIRDAMLQQSLEYERQINSIGKVQTNLSKLEIEFKKGGKYVGEQNTELGKQLIAEAKALDLAKLKYDGEEAIKKVLEEHSKLRDKADEDGKNALALVIERRQAEREAFDLANKDIKIATERLDYEKTLVGLSDTQVRKALEYFDLRQKMIRLSETEIGLDETQLAERQKLEQNRIKSEEDNARAQKTFQAGWDKALSNYSEKMKDSAALGTEAFNTMTSNMESALDNFVSTGKLSFGDLTQSIISNLIKIQLKTSMMGIFGGGGGLGDIFGGIFGGSGGVSATAGAYSIENNPFIGMYADGGDPPVGKPSIVGERGAELFVPRTAGTIIPNNTLSSMMGNQPQTVYNGTVIQNMSAIDTQSGVQFLAKNKNAVWSANMSAQRGMPQNR